MRIRDGESDARGKRKREYKAEDCATPCEKLKSLGAEEYLKEMSFARLDEAALKMSDTECARKMMAAKQGVRRGQGYGNDGAAESVETQNGLHPKSETRS